MSPQQTTALARRMNETPRTPRPNRTPQSLPQWETLQESPPSASTSSGLKRTDDDVSDQDPPSPPKKKRRRSKKKDASSRIEGTTPVTVTLGINQPSLSHSVLRVSSGFNAGNNGQDQTANGSPCEERVDRMKKQGRKTVRFTYATTRTMSSRTDESGGSTSTPSASGEVTAPEQSTQSSAEAQSQSPASPKKTNKRKRSEQVAELGPESEATEEISSPRKRNRSERTAELSDGAPNVEESVTTSDPRYSRKKSGKTKDKWKGKEMEMANPCSSDSSPGAGPSSSPRTTAYSESQREESELPSSDTLVADDDEEDWIKMLSSELNLDEDHKDILEDISDEPDDRKLVFLIASQMASNPVPKDARRFFNGLAQEVLLNFSGPCLFKDRSLNNWQLLERIRRKPEKVGLDETWISNAGKLRLLDEIWQKNFAEARRNIIEKIAQSIDERYSLIGLAHILDKDVTESDLNILALLRSIYRKEGRVGFFNRVDEKLRQLHTTSLGRFRRSFERYRRNDARRFPDTADAAERAGLRRSWRRRRQGRTNQDISWLGSQYNRPGHT